MTCFHFSMDLRQGEADVWKRVRTDCGQWKELDPIHSNLSPLPAMSRFRSAWRNGILDAATGSFVHHADVKEDDTLRAYAYVAHDYDTTDYGEAAWKTIEHPSRRLFDEQGYSRAEQLWLYGLLGGRLLCEMEQGFRTQDLLTVGLYGEAGTGCSIWWNLLQKGLGGSIHCAVLRKEFGVSKADLMYSLTGNKRLFVCLDNGGGKIVEEIVRNLQDVDVEGCDHNRDIRIHPKLAHPHRETLHAPLILIGKRGVPVAWARARSRKRSHYTFLANMERKTDFKRDSALFDKCCETFGTWFRLCVECWHHIKRLHTPANGNELWHVIPERFRFETQKLLERTVS